MTLLEQKVRTVSGGADVSIPGPARRLHVLHVIDRLARGGAERMLVDLANQTSADGLRVSVCITRSGGELIHELDSKIELLELGRTRRLDWRAMYCLRRFVHQREVNVLHLHGRSSYALLALMKAARLISRPLILHDHFGRIEVDQSVPVWFTLAGKYLLDRYVGVYEALGTWARSAGIAPERIHVIGNTLDLRRLAKVKGAVGASLPMNPDHPVGVTVAGIRWEKGTDTLLQGVALLPPEVRFTLFIVGGIADPDYAAHCRNLASKLDVNNRVIFLGARGDVPDLLHAADFAVMSSRSESGPLVLIEYMAAGLPFVSTRVGDVSRKAERLGMQEFVRPDDPAAIATALGNLLSLPREERRLRGDRGRDVVMQHFDLRKTMPQWYRIYDAVRDRYLQPHTFGQESPP